MRSSIHAYACSYITVNDLLSLASGLTVALIALDLHV